MEDEHRFGDSATDQMLYAIQHIAQGLIYSFPVDYKHQSTLEEIYKQVQSILDDT